MLLCIDHALSAAPQAAIVENGRLAEVDLEEMTRGLSRADRLHVSLVPLQTDLNFSSVGLLRIGQDCSSALQPDAASALPPFPVAMSRGGVNLLGSELPRDDPATLRNSISALVQQGVRTLVISAAGVLAKPEIEVEIARTARDLDPGLSVVLSGELGGIGIREREASGLITAALQPWAKRAIARLREVTGLGASRIFVSTGIGSIIDAGLFKKHPILALGGVRGARLRGAAMFASRGRLAVLVPSVQYADHLELTVLRDGEPERMDPVSFGGKVCSVRASAATLIKQSEPADAIRAILSGTGAPVAIDHTLHHRWGEVAHTVALPPLSGCEGLAGALVTVESERILMLPDEGRRTAATERMRGEMEHSLLLAGADPRRIGTVTIEFAPVSYLPQGLSYVRARASEERSCAE